jgi:hypothetical protein
MRSVLIDASSAILLYKVDLFGPVAAVYRLKAVPAVIREITVAGHTGAAYFRRAHGSGDVAPADPGPDGNRSTDSSLGDGERETLLAYGNTQGDFVMIDDRRGVAACRAGGIPHINALLCPRLLYWSGAIDRTRSRDVFQRLLDVGRYSRRVIDYARTCTPGMLERFLPPEFRHAHRLKRAGPL